VIGCSGAGKSTLSRKLAELTGLPLIHLDREYWQPGWAAPDNDAWLVRLRQLVAGPRWIMDGNFGGTLPLRVALADTIIFLDFPTPLCIWRVLRRVARTYGQTRIDMAAHCPERFDWAFLVWVYRWRRNSRPRVLAAMEGFQGSIEVLRNPGDVAAFLARIGQIT